MDDEQSRPAAVGQVERPVRPLAPWDDDGVQIVYEVLCSDEEPPHGEHWEGFVARRAVGELMKRMEGMIPLPRTADEAEAMARASLMWLHQHAPERLREIAA